MANSNLEKGLELPDEIWMRIVQHIPSGREGQLYGVNRSLFYIVMATRYGRVQISSLFKPRVQRMVCGLRSPYVANSIKEIEFTLGEFQKYLKFPKSQSKLDRLFNRPIPPIEPVLSVRVTLEPLSTEVDFSSQFPSLHTVYLLYRADCFSAQHYSTFLTIYKPYLQNGLKSIAKNLRSLTFDIPLEFYRDGILKKTLFFPFLEALDMSFGKISRKGNVDGSDVAPFIIRHSNTLTKLALRFRDHTPSFWAQLDGVEYFVSLLGSLCGASQNSDLSSSLHALSLSELTVHLPIHYVRQRELSALPNFIKRHARTMKILDLLLHDPRVNGSATLADHPPISLLLSDSIPSLSALKALHIHFLYEETFLRDPEPLLACISTAAWVESLVTLDLDFNRLEQADVVQLVSQNNFSSLQSLKIKVKTLTTALFDTLAHHLPLLQSLKITTKSVQAKYPDQGAPDTSILPSSLFLADLQASCYSHWKSLSSLALHLIHRSHWDSWYSVGDPNWLTESQVRGVFPTVITFDLYSWGSYEWSD
ncbi:hypothetical protein DFP72DRAFT_1165448 [Ephemerocybe angulata]|uniref:F-box domain-containing protein n=1 Tax=Ephemerocybe angulata TaxID=980116 RepID=A0A8H6MF65_9AGAR|nr:hypothetical protein DFP72DRAFT_1165448 [Tulosesus angulatus]